MKARDFEARSRHFSLPSLIAWLSVCLLAAAFGRTIDESWQNLWMYAGIFGLVAAVGLGKLESSRLLRQQGVREETLRMRSEGRLTAMDERTAAIDTIDQAIERVVRYATFQEETLDGYPLEIVPVDECWDTLKLDLACSIAGSLRRFSSSNIDFEHVKEFAEHVVLLIFRLEKQRQICFVVEIKVTQPTAGGFASSGTVMAVGVPNDYQWKQPMMESHV